MDRIVGFKDGVGGSGSVSGEFPADPHDDKLLLQGSGDLIVGSKARSRGGRDLGRDLCQLVEKAMGPAGAFTLPPQLPRTPTLSRC